MPLDPQAQALLEQLKQAGAKPVEVMTVAEARALSWSYIDLQGAPESVAAVTHRFIPGPSADLPIRIYHPAGPGPFPALVLFHGSGWVVANLDVVDAPARALANCTGCVIVAVNYQKAPEHKFPVPLDDCYATTAWVAAHAEALRVDPARIGVAGDSAGGNLAAAVALKARDAGGPALAYQLLIYPATNYDLDTPSALANAEGYLLQRESMRWFWDHYLADAGDADNPLACPLRAADLSGLPPAFVVTAEFDPLCDDGERYADALRAAGVPVTYRRYDGMVHGFFWMAGVLDQARALYEEIGKEVRASL